MKIEYDNLKKAVDEMNEQFDLEPAIPTKSVVQMRKDVLETFEDEDGDLCEGSEKFTKETIDVFDELEIDVSDFNIKKETKKGEKKMAATKTKEVKKTAKKKVVKPGKVSKKVIEKKEKIVKGKKVVEKKVVQKKVSSNGRVKGIGKYVVENIKKKKFKNMTNQEIADTVRDKFESNTKATCISWYKQKIKKGLM